MAVGLKPHPVPLTLLNIAELGLPNQFAPIESLPFLIRLTGLSTSPERQRWCRSFRAWFPRRKTAVQIIDRVGKWWAHLDSNQGPTGYEPVALTN